MLERLLEEGRPLVAAHRGKSGAAIAENTVKAALHAFKEGADIVAKAGVGRATFYRYFKSKEDVIIYYFERHTREFVFEQRIIPRGKEDHIKIAFDTLTMFKQNKEPFKLLQKAHLTDLYLGYLNKKFVQNFERDNNDKNRYLPYLYAGMLYNVSMKWLEDDCKEDAQTLAAMIVGAIYDKGDKE